MKNKFAKLSKNFLSSFFVKDNYIWYKIYCKITYKKYKSKCLKYQIYKRIINKKLTDSRRLENFKKIKTSIHKQKSNCFICTKTKQKMRASKNVKKK